MQFGAAVTEVRARTDQDLGGTAAEDAPVKDSTIWGWINTEYPLVRRVLAKVAPTLFKKTVTVTIAAGSNSWSVNADFEEAYLVERKASDGQYDPIEAADELDPESCTGYAWREGGSIDDGRVLEFFPSASCAGDFRVSYIRKPTALTAVGNEIRLPDGAEEILIERVCAKVRRRVEEDPMPHELAAERALAETTSYLQSRRGVHPEGFFRRRRE